MLDEGSSQPPKLAFLGVRPCELAAIRVQDRVFGVDRPQAFRCESETWYTQARQQALLLAVNCTRPGGTCFCASWGTGPAAKDGFDLALTELRNGFLVEVGSARGNRSPASSPCASRRRPSRAGRVEARSGPASGWAASSTREGIKDLLDGRARASRVGRGGPPLPLLRQLHDGLPDLFLLDGERCDRI